MASGNGYLRRDGFAHHASTKGSTFAAPSISAPGMPPMVDNMLGQILAWTDSARGSAGEGEGPMPQVNGCSPG